MMLHAPLPAVAIAAFLLGAGCGKRARCEKAFQNLEQFTVDLMKKAGGSEDEARKSFEGGKSGFMDSCKKWSNEQIDCLSGDLTKTMNDPKCADAMKGFGH